MKPIQAENIFVKKKTQINMNKDWSTKIPNSQLYAK